MMKILVTGSAGFIGFHLTKKLLDEGYEIIGLDVINDYYDINIKFSRLELLGITADKIEKKEVNKSHLYDNFSFIKADLADHSFVVNMMCSEKFDYVINLAAQAGVRNSIENPLAYTHSNVDGFLSILEGSRHSNVKHLIYASTSSVYGLNTSMPYRESDSTDHPMALYAATKKANELMAHSYSHLFGLPTSGLRFFTVYGPWGRPDMALHLFTDAIIKGEPINLFNHGDMIRDFTYVDDIVESISRLVIKPPVRDSSQCGIEPRTDTSSAPYRIFNVGNGCPVSLMRYIEAIESELSLKAQYNMMDMQPGDVPATHADTTELKEYTGFRPSTTIEAGVKSFVEWFTEYYR